MGSVKTDHREPFAVMGDGWNWFKIVSVDGLWY